jgi:hypothetical protein
MRPNFRSTNLGSMLRRTGRHGQTAANPGWTLMVLDSR